MSSVSPEISQVLAQMRVMQAQAQSEVPRAATEVQAASSFGKILANSIDTVNAAQQHTSALRTAFTQGDPNVSLAEVMIASQKSKIGFSAMLEVRNKFLEAYKEVMRMPV